MRQPFFALILALAPGPLLAGSFDLSLDEENGQRVIAVARSGGGAYAVAAGAEDLKVLTGEAADQALASLATVDAGDDIDEPAAEGGKRKKAKKIVIHKMSIEDDDDGDGARDDDNREVRIIRKTDSDRREERLLLEDDDHLMKGDDERTAERRIVRMKGVDEAQAISFIDETKGLDAGEKAQMKIAAGL